MLDACKLALRITTTAYDTRLTALIQAAKKDLGIAGIDLAMTGPDPLIKEAVVNYVLLHFGTLTTSEYPLIKASYDEQKAQMSMATGYTDWGDGSVSCCGNLSDQ